MSPLVPARRGAALASAAASRLSRPPVRPSRRGGPPHLLDGAAADGRPVRRIGSAPAASSGVSRPPPFEGPDRAGAPRACQVRTLATSRQRRAAAAASKSEEETRGVPSASSDSDGTSQQSRQSQRHPLAGKRPGETGFSPPADKLRPSDGGVGRGQGAGAGPLVVPSGIPPPTACGDDGSGDNRGHAHLQPTSSLLDGGGEGDGGHGALRSHFLRQGIIPSPRVDSSRLPPDEIRRIRDPSTPPPGVPPPDPRGVSSANPEDVIDMATLYDPSVHLPDKPDFSSASNRERYEGGTPLTDELVAYIGVRGPITTAEFMRRALRHEDHGYYTGKGARAGGAPARSAEAGAGAAGEADDDGLEEDDNDWDLDDDSDDYAGIRSDGSSRAAGGDRVIGRSGDFITAPEISQLFGESLLVWFMTQYAAMGRPSRVQLIEIGPGRGTLVCDMVRSAVERFPDLSEALANGAGGVGVHLVEVTNGMRARQRRALEDLAGESIMVEKGYSFDFPGDEGAGKSESPDGDDAPDEPSPSPSAAETKRSISVTWHDAHGSVPSKDADGAPVPTFVVCQELVDALPVHSFQKTEEGVWRERLVDVAVRDEEEAEAEAARVGGGVAAAARARGRYASAEGADKVRSSFSSAAESAPRTGGTAAAAGAKKGDKLPRLRFVLPPDTTPAVRTLLRVDATGRPLPDNPAAPSLDALPPGSVVEACPEGLLLAQDIARRIDDCGGRGAALVVDYGGDGSGGGDTLRGFARHRQVHPLSRPGEVDVTADVDFGALREAVNRRVGARESFERFRRRQSGGIAGATADVEPAPPGEGTAPSGSSIKTEAYGPITQGRFLAAMGIVERVERRIELDSTTDDEAAELVSSLERLMDPDEMGERYKVMAIAPGRRDGLFPPPAF